MSVFHSSSSLSLDLDSALVQVVVQGLKGVSELGTEAVEHQLWLDELLCQVVIFVGGRVLDD